MLIASPESWLGEEIEGFQLKEVIGNGKIGVVFLAVHKSIPTSRRACKIIREGELKSGWEREIQKVSLLAGVPEIVDVISWGNGIRTDGQKFTFINYRFVDGTNLRDFLRANDRPEFGFILALGGSLLRAKHACDAVSVVHGDIHEGNVLIANQDPRFPEQGRRVVVTDFGYGGSHNGLAPKDDSLQISSIMCGLLRRSSDDVLEATDRAIREKLIEFFGKELTDSYARNTDPSPPQTASNIARSSLFQTFESRINQAKVAAANAGKGVSETNADDYLNAEALGHRQDEWQNLFVPEILGANAFTSRNVTIITGARGCGKTMAFRRLTLFLDELIGSPSGVRGADNILGFYLNCRDVVEVFPYTGAVLRQPHRDQIVHFFHLCWLQEIFRAFGQRQVREVGSYAWIYEWISRFFGSTFVRPIVEQGDPLMHLLAFVGDQKELCRTMPLGKQKQWPLDRVDLLDDFYVAASANVPWIKSQPFFFFLDDYTIPLLSEQLQSTLNPIVFKRRANVFFKISTEASNSFLRIVGKKPLEVNHDFDLVDLANETLHIDDPAKLALLDSIFRRRIRRIDELRARNLGLVDVLGASNWSYNQLARTLREARGASSNPIYYGEKAFVGMWSSDIRSMIQLFNELMRPFRLNKGGAFPISRELQQARYYESGGEFLNLTETVRSAGFWDGEARAGAGPRNFGRRLREIATTFIAVCRWELMEQPLMRNQKTESPKQAFRIEIVDALELPDKVQTYYHGLIRWHVFLPDWRGRSVRGVMTPRMFLNKRLLPYARLSFSGKDSISLTNAEFQSLLTAPSSFLSYWKNKKRKQNHLAARRGEAQSELKLEDESDAPNS